MWKKTALKSLRFSVCLRLRESERVTEKRKIRLFRQADFGFFMRISGDLSKKKDSSEELSFFWQRHKNLNASVQNLVTRLCLVIRILRILRFFEKEKQTPDGCLSLFGRGIRIRTLNDGVRVRSVTVTLCLYICAFAFCK